MQLCKKKFGWSVHFDAFSSISLDFTERFYWRHHGCGGGTSSTMMREAVNPPVYASPARKVPNNIGSYVRVAPGKSWLASTQLVTQRPIRTRPECIPMQLPPNAKCCILYELPEGSCTMASTSPGVLHSTPLNVKYQRLHPSVPFTRTSPSKVTRTAVSLLLLLNTQSCSWNTNRKMYKSWFIHRRMMDLQGGNILLLRVCNNLENKLPHGDFIDHYCAEWLFYNEESYKNNFQPKPWSEVQYKRHQNSTKCTVHVKFVVVERKQELFMKSVPVTRDEREEMWDMLVCCLYTQTCLINLDASDTSISAYSKSLYTHTGHKFWTHATRLGILLPANS